ncbi:MAG: ornithine carbamoyltransferase [candidate division Zixibacteria bacterium]|nr:ornithine carbamoyltransferase [candidate division Zixibacteria bacterium]
MKKDFLAVSDFSAKEIKEVFKLTSDMKKGKLKSQPLKNKAVACIFHKPSLRTRISFEVGIQQLGGSSYYITRDEFKLGKKDDPEKREWFYDGAKVLSRMVDLIVIRTYEHSGVEELTKYSDIPVINALTDLYHPCQILGDIFTIWEKRKKIENISIAYLGDGNNVCNSWLDAASIIPLDLRIGTSAETFPDKGVLKRAKESKISKVNLTDNPISAVKDADVLYTDVWASMGQESLYEKKVSLLRKFQINTELIRHAKKDCLVMHCLPAHRGEEITDQAMDGKNSVVFDQAENRLHIQKGIILKLMRGFKREK